MDFSGRKDEWFIYKLSRCRFVACSVFIKMYIQDRGSWKSEEAVGGKSGVEHPLEGGSTCGRSKEQRSRDVM